MRSYFLFAHMKILFFGILVAVCMLAGRNFVPMKTEAEVKPSYVNETFGYAVNFGGEYKANPDMPELVFIEKPKSRLRINSGCYDFGTSGLLASAQPAKVAGLDAMQEDFYDNSALVLRKITFHYKKLCYALEMQAESEDGWQELREIIKSFRFTR